MPVPMSPPNSSLASPVSPISIFTSNPHDVHDHWGIRTFSGRPESSPKAVRRPLFLRSHSTPPDNSFDSDGFWGREQQYEPPHQELHYHHDVRAPIRTHAELEALIFNLERGTEAARDVIEELNMELQEAREKMEEMKELSLHLQIDTSMTLNHHSWNLLPQHTCTPSNVEVVRAVECINEEIAKLSSIGTVHIRNKHVVAEKDKKHAMGLLEPIFHHSFLNVLLPLNCRDSKPIKAGWCAILVYCCSKMIRKWMTQGTLTNPTSSIQLQSMDPQLVDENWRLMSPGEVFNKISPGERDDVIKEFTKHLLALPLLCGYINDKRTYSNMGNIFHQSMRPLVHRCVELSELLTSAGSGDTTLPTGGELRPYIQHSGDILNPESADVVKDADGRMEVTGTVACTLSMGLCWARKGASCRVQGKRGSLVKAEPIVKANVLLLSTFNSSYT